MYLTNFIYIHIYVNFPRHLKCVFLTLKYLLFYPWDVRKYYIQSYSGITDKKMEADRVLMAYVLQERQLMTALGSELRSSWLINVQFAYLFKIKYHHLTIDLNSASHHNIWILSLKTKRSVTQKHFNLLFFQEVPKNEN